MKTKAVLFLLWVLLAAVSLPGCAQGRSFSSTAEAAIQAIIDLHMVGFTIDTGSIRVLHQQQIGTIRLVTTAYSATSADSGPEVCLFDVETVRAGLFSWQSRNSNGGCVPNPPAAGQPPILIGSHNGTEQGSQVYSSFSGLPLQEGIDSVQITWSDGKVEKVSGAGGLFFSSRSGEYTLKKLEVLDAEMKTIFAQVFQ